jgi:hypothetical protein
VTVWDVATWVAIAILGPGVLVICVAVARDVRRLLGGAAPPVPPVAGRSVDGSGPSLT